MGRPKNSKKRKQYNFTSKSKATTAPKKKRYQWNTTPVPGASIYDSQGIRDQRGRTPHNSMAKAFKLIHAEEQKIKDAAFNKRMAVQRNTLLHCCLSSSILSRVERKWKHKNDPVPNNCILSNAKKWKHSLAGITIEPAQAARQCTCGMMMCVCGE